MKAKELLSNLGRAAVGFATTYYYAGVYEDEPSFVKSLFGEQAEIRVNRKLYADELLALNRQIHMSNRGEYLADAVVYTNDERKYNTLYLYNIDD